MWPMAPAERNIAPHFSVRRSLHTAWREPKRLNQKIVCRCDVLIREQE